MPDPVHYFELPHIHQCSTSKNKFSSSSDTCPYRTIFDLTLRFTQLVLIVYGDHYKGKNDHRLPLKIRLMDMSLVYCLIEYDLILRKSAALAKTTQLPGKQAPLLQALP